jgi:hypothetical protein
VSGTRVPGSVQEISRIFSTVFTGQTLPAGQRKELAWGCI